MDKPPNNKPLNPDRETHDAAWDLLPWYASGALDPAERASVSRHLESCTDCRDELALERQSRATFRVEACAPRSPEPGLARLLAQLPPQEVPRPAVTQPARWLAAVLTWLDEALPRPAMIGAGALALFATVLGVASLRAPDPLGYHVLSNAQIPGANESRDIHLVFAAEVSAARRAELLGAMRGRIVDGPNSVGAYTVRFPSLAGQGELVALIEDLRSRPEVVLAEAAQALAMPHDGPPSELREAP
ncbi:MAG: zf-HC2 domain-containing protein [Panacagrimonas sp.]